MLIPWRVNLARFSSGLPSNPLNEAIEDVDDGFRLKVLRTMEEKTCSSQKGHFLNSRIPKGRPSFSGTK